MRKAINAMLNCRSNSQRTSHWACHGCIHTADFPLSCGHRSCPQSRHHTTQDWLAKQQAMFTVAASMLKDFTLNSPKLEGDIGFTGVLHTHSRRRALLLT
jgi:hypothetical protein